jgi:hypothetical protein
MFTLPHPDPSSLTKVLPFTSIHGHQGEIDARWIFHIVMTQCGVKGHDKIPRSLLLGSFCVLFLGFDIQLHSRDGAKLQGWALSGKNVEAPPT